MLPDKRGYFGPFGGRYVPETLVAPLTELEDAFRRARKDVAFRRELAGFLQTYAGRPSPLYLAQRLSRKLSPSGSVKIYFKREDLCHTGSHKINNTLGQCLLAKRLGKSRVIAETGAGQHGVATATAAAVFGLKCDVYMGEEDMRRQELNVFRMEMLGARVIPVKSGTRTLKDAINEAMRDWVTNVSSTYYVLGSVVGPHPYPWMVREFQSVIGQEARSQIRALEKRLPDALMACVGGGSNAIGLFAPFFNDRKVAFVGVEAGGLGSGAGRNAATLGHGKIGILHGAKTLLLQDSEGQVSHTHSVAAGLDYPAVGPEHAYYKYTGRARYVSVTDKEALQGFKLLSEIEGISPALETAHAVGYLPKLVSGGKGHTAIPSFSTGGEALSSFRKGGLGRIIVVCLSGRGDKDVAEVKRILNSKHEILNKSK